MAQRPILLADDIESRTDAAKRRSETMRRVASSLAQRLRIGIDLLYVEDIKAYSRKFNASRLAAWHRGHQERLAELSRQLPETRSSIIGTGSPADQILAALCTRPSPELVVVGTRGRKGLHRLLIGSVAEEVVRHARRPVMVIGPMAQGKPLEFSGKRQLKLLVATDLGRNSRAAEHYALSLAKRLSAEVVLYHCLGDSHRLITNDCAMVSGWTPINMDEILDGIRTDAVRAMKQKAEYMRSRGVACEYQIDDEPLTSSCAVYQESAKGYSSVIMGTRGRNVMLEAYFGSTARETILHAPVPVITVRAGR
jgi:nucleotide-binding universal stress UspA family protein